MASESETSDDGSYNYLDSEAVPDGNSESEELVMHRLSEPLKDESIDVQVVEGLSYIAETELAGPAPALLDLELIQTKGEVSAKVSEGEVSVRVSDTDSLFLESEPTHTGQRCKCRDMSGLSQCWVSSRPHDQPLMCFYLLANSVHSITFSA